MILAKEIRPPMHHSGRRCALFMSSQEEAGLISPTVEPSYIFFFLGVNSRTRWGGILGRRSRTHDSFDALLQRRTSPPNFFFSIESMHTFMGISLVLNPDAVNKRWRYPPLSHPLHYNITTSQSNASHAVIREVEFLASGLRFSIAQYCPRSCHIIAEVLAQYAKRNVQITWLEEAPQ